MAPKSKRLQSLPRCAPALLCASQPTWEAGACPLLSGTWAGRNMEPGAGGCCFPWRQAATSSPEWISPQKEEAPNPTVLVAVEVRGAAAHRSNLLLCEKRNTKQRALSLSVVKQKLSVVGLWMAADPWASGCSLNTRARDAGGFASFALGLLLSPWAACGSVPYSSVVFDV